MYGNALWMCVRSFFLLGKGNDNVPKESINDKLDRGSVAAQELEADDFVPQTLGLWVANGMRAIQNLNHFAANVHGLCDHK